ncbi:U3 snoRNP protein [Coemansia brasiliensis]|uniref:U3 small nucleolar ribonucleoprotein protein MPP10 n=1 Tax=Coemansia brasiliensis TaxID=2650707 RepID=A0A9W8IB41_9FUNG|nr:U3 snoRNP protein [Coemansia brasiliensis]
MGKKRATAKATKAPGALAASAAFGQVVPESFIEKFIDSPGSFIVPTAEARDAAMEVVSRTYDAANMTEKYGLFDSWNAVINSGFDPNVQLWELINVRNEPVLKSTADTMKELTQLLESVESDESSSESSDNDMDVSDEQQEAADLESAESELESESDAEQSDDQIVNSGQDTSEDESEEESNVKPSAIDDKFFSLAEMEKFADQAEEEEEIYQAALAGSYSRQNQEDDEDDDESSDDESIDLFQDHGNDDEDSDTDSKHADELMYDDFFKPPKGSKRGKAKKALERHAKRVKFDPNLVESDEESEVEPEVEDGPTVLPQNRTSNLFEDDEEDKAVSDGKSDFERRQEKLQGLIGKLEDEAVAPKHWSMIGEVSSNVRPQNSLLAEDMEFDHMQKPVPVITHDATVTLEDIIKRRILNEEWDDVERKKDIQAKPFKPSEFIELNDKQSKKSLAEEYEAEYMAQKAGDAFVPESDAKLAESHKDVDSQMRNLFTQLDALSHFHFAPKPAATDIEIRTNVPALQMEEKLPVSMTQADQLAPSEIFEKRQPKAGRTGDLVGDTEMSREDRKRRRQRKKNEKKKQAATKAPTAKASS